jgi:ankyrin repeat protein
LRNRIVFFVDHAIDKLCASFVLTSGGARSRSRPASSGETTAEIPLVTVEDASAQVVDVDVLLDGEEVPKAVVDDNIITAAVRAAQYSRIDELRGLLDSGSITVNTKDSEDCTLLQWAAINNRNVIIQELLVNYHLCVIHLFFLNL